MIAKADVPVVYRSRAVDFSEALQSQYRHGRRIPGCTKHEQSIEHGKRSTKHGTREERGTQVRYAL